MIDKIAAFQNLKAENAKVKKLCYFFHELLNTLVMLI
jgi:hypothetical protein